MKFNFIGNPKNYKSILLSASIVKLARTLQHFSVFHCAPLRKLNVRRFRKKCIEEKLCTIIVSMLYLFMKSGEELLYSF